MTTWLDEINDFIDTLPTPLPTNPIQRIRLLARELALGHCEGLWLEDIYIDDRRHDLRHLRLRRYFEKRWKGTRPYDLMTLLRLNEFIDINFHLRKTAYDLIGESEPFNVFISYKRTESSALALLVNHRLQSRGLIPFVDMATKIGDNWYDELHKRIKECDYFIVLLGRNTLSSEMTVQEIRWAIKYRERDREEEKEEKKIIPVWHSGFGITHKRWKDVDQAVKAEISANNAIRVTDESASGYNSAIVELLNRFGVTP